jgi:6-phosphogluconolactonase
VMIYKFNSATGKLAENSFAAVPPGSGARHLAFSPDGKFAHVVNEMGCTVTTFAWDSGAGELTPVETVSALPPGDTAQQSFTAAEIVASGNYVYATVRGHDSVTAFAADPQTGRLAFLQNIPCGGKVPRGLGVDPTGRWLIVGNQKSDNAVEFSIDARTGKLSPTGQELKIGSPVDVKFVEGN